ncbi:hypothetical protein LTR97_008438 [Elasticomyces elasticus]|uniref:F-box domain-containing protein n=1 Tax=Elasticomyces elasticus TaxID=574655 RepID=A0AAN7ZSZ3_9PEZI|nr:hypothetical protein LTR97_008438 [Elasticomyces elasticus]KAK5719345.1 hypothetical protein LTR15_007868 [Elasticomyces elasticus]
MDIAGLPLDVRVAIASYIHRQRDIVSLTRSCWALYAATIPQLYRDLTVCESVDVNHLIAMLSPDNGGLQHVRRLEVIADLVYIYNQPNIDQLLQLIVKVFGGYPLLALKVNVGGTTESGAERRSMSIIGPFHERRNAPGTEA